VRVSKAKGVIAFEETNTVAIKNMEIGQED